MQKILYTYKNKCMHNTHTHTYIYIYISLYMYFKVNVTWGSSPSGPVLLVMPHQHSNPNTWNKQPLLIFKQILVASILTWLENRIRDDFYQTWNISCRHFLKAKAKIWKNNNKSKNSHPTPTMQNADNDEKWEVTFTLIGGAVVAITPAVKN